MGMIILFISFDPTGLTAAVVNGTTGNFNGFDSIWYRTMGK